MSSLKDFQNLHGRDWAQLIGTPAFGAALAVAHTERLQEITDLSDKEISEHGVIILSDLRGHLQYESALLGMHEKKEFVFQQLGEEEYPSPIEEANEQASTSPGEVQSPSGLSSIGPSAHEEIFPPARRKRGRPPKGKNK